MKQMAVCMAIILAMFSHPLNAQNRPQGFHKSFYANMGLCAGNLHQNFITTTKSNPRFGLSLSLAFFLTPWLQLGGTATGWSYESENYNDWTKGVYVSNSLLHARIYPIPKAGLFTSAGYGFASYTNRNPGPSNGYTTGPGYMVNMGYEFHISGKSRVTTGTTISYHWGSIKNDPFRELQHAQFNTLEFLVFMGFD